MIGMTIGPFQVVAKLGAGGMGEVYRARDTKLRRDVAIKVLPAAAASDPDRLARFEREARVLASLNHANIAAIYGVEDSRCSFERCPMPRRENGRSRENGGNTSRWRADGRELYFLSLGSMMAAEIDPASSFRVRAIRRLFESPPPFGAAAGQYSHGWGVTSDGQRFITTLPEPDVPARAITVVMNWQAALK